MHRCGECGKEFDSERGLKVHTSQVHEDEDVDAIETKKKASVGNVTFRLNIRHALVIMFAAGVMAGSLLTMVGFNTGVMGTPTAAVGSNADNGAGTPTDGGQNERVAITSDMLEDEPSIGSDDAPVKVIEYSDFGCPWCAEWAGVDVSPRSPVSEQNVLEQMKEDYINSGDVQFIYKDYPVQRLHPNAASAHVAANCIRENEGDDAYWQFHDKLFEQRDAWTKNGQDNPQQTFQNIAQDIGADVNALTQCMQNADGNEIQEDINQIQDVDGQLGTPTFYIGNTEDGFVKVSGAKPYSALQELIDSELS